MATEAPSKGRASLLTAEKIVLQPGSTLKVTGEKNKFPPRLNNADLNDAGIKEVAQKLREKYRRDGAAGCSSSHEYIHLKLINFKQVPRNDFVLKEVSNITSLESVFLESQKILLLGEAGVGKTTLTHHISYEWAEERLWNQMFDLVFKIQLRNLRGTSYSAPVYITSIYYQECLSTSGLNISLLEKVLADEKKRILLILDGYDELSLEMPYFSVIRDVLENERLFVLATSRPCSQVVEDFANYKIIKCMGFDKDSIASYIKLNANISKQFVEEAFRSNPSLYNILHIPLLLKIACKTWQEGLEQDKKVYASEMEEWLEKMIGKLWENYGEYLNKTYGKKSAEKIQKSKNEAKEFIRLLAFKAVQTHSVLLDKDLISLTIKQIYHGENDDVKFYLNELIKCGYLNSDEKRTRFYFSHNLFQEFFSAQYLVEHQDELFDKEIFQKNKYNPHYETVWKFLARNFKARGEVEHITSCIEILDGDRAHLQYFLLKSCFLEAGNEINKNNPFLKEVINELDKSLELENYSRAERIVGFLLCAPKVCQCLAENLKFHMEELKERNLPLYQRWVLLLSGTCRIPPSLVFVLISLFKKTGGTKRRAENYVYRHYAYEALLGLSSFPLEEAKELIDLLENGEAWLAIKLFQHVNILSEEDPMLSKLVEKVISLIKKGFSENNLRLARCSCNALASIRVIPKKFTSELIKFLFLANDENIQYFLCQAINKICSRETAEKLFFEALNKKNFASLAIRFFKHKPDNLHQLLVNKFIEASNNPLFLKVLLKIFKSLLIIDASYIRVFEKNNPNFFDDPLNMRILSFFEKIPLETEEKIIEALKSGSNEQKESVFYILQHTKCFQSKLPVEQIIKSIFSSYPDLASLPNKVVKAFKNPEITYDFKSEDIANLITFLKSNNGYEIFLASNILKSQVNKLASIEEEITNQLEIDNVSAPLFLLEILAEKKEPSFCYVIVMKMLKKELEQVGWNENDTTFLLINYSDGINNNRKIALLIEIICHFKPITKELATLLIGFSCYTGAISRQAVNTLLSNLPFPIDAIEGLIIFLECYKELVETNGATYSANLRAEIVWVLPHIAEHLNNHLNFLLSLIDVRDEFMPAIIATLTKMKILPRELVILPNDNLACIKYININLPELIEYYRAAESDKEKTRALDIFLLKASYERLKIVFKENTLEFIDDKPYTIQINKSEVESCFKKIKSIQERVALFDQKKGRVSEEKLNIIEAIQRSNVKSLISLVTEINVNDCVIINKDTLLQLAIYKKDFPIVELFITKGANINLVGDCLWSALHTAVDMNAPDIVKLLLKNEANPNAKRDDGMTPLHLAAYWNYADIASILLNYGAEVDASSHNKTWLVTPLDWAIYRQNLEVGRVLLSHNAHSQFISTSNKRAYDELLNTAFIACDRLLAMQEEYTAVELLEKQELSQEAYLQSMLKYIPLNLDIHQRLREKALGTVQEHIQAVVESKQQEASSNVPIISSTPFWVNPPCSTATHNSFIGDEEAQQFCEQNGLREFRAITRDGHCFFHAVLAGLLPDHLLNHTIEGHLKLREQAVQYMRNNQERFPPSCIENESLEEYLNRMAKPTQWAEGPIIAATALLLNITIHLIELKKKNGQLETSGHFTAREVENADGVILVRVNQNHYHLGMPLQSVMCQLEIRPFRQFI